MSKGFVREGRFALERKRPLGPPPRPRRPVYSVALKAQLGRRLALICAELGCLAIEARALWVDGAGEMLGEAEAGAAEGDVRRLRRIPRQRSTP